MNGDLKDAAVLGDIGTRWNFSTHERACTFSGGSSTVALALSCESDHAHMQSSNDTAVPPPHGTMGLRMAVEALLPPRNHPGNHRQPAFVLQGLSRMLLSDPPRTSNRKSKVA